MNDLVLNEIIEPIIDDEEEQAVADNVTAFHEV
jgi:hypothetical protein